MGASIWNPGQNSFPVSTSDLISYKYPEASDSISRTVESRLSDYVSVKDFGAVGDGEFDNTEIIQRAEDSAAAIALSLNSPVDLIFPPGIFAITATLNKRTGVHWKGPGKIKRKDSLAPSGTQWALVFADQVDNWSITGVGFEAIAHEIVSDLNLPRAFSNSAQPSAWNSCIDAYKCQHWEVRQCSFLKFSQGVKWSGSGNFSIVDNKFTAGNSYSVTNVLAGTPQSFAFSGTSCISYLYDQTLLPLRPPGPFRISGNKLSAAGLDGGIDVVLNTYGRAPSLICDNIIEGSHYGILAYQGSLPDDGNSLTYQSASIISNNHIYATWEQGIYIRGTLGVQVLGNYIERAAQATSNPDASAGAIVLRVNPFDTAVSATYISAADGEVSDDHAILIEGNRCVNTGRVGAVVPTAVIYIRINNAKCINNDIVQAAEAFNSAVCPAILVANGGRLVNFEIAQNKISGAFTTGILVADVLRLCSFTTHRGRLYDNDIKLTNSTAGIDVDWKAFNLDIQRNYISGTPIAIRTRFAPYSRIESNNIFDCDTGINLSDGSLASDCAHLISGGVATRAIRRGGTVSVCNNKFLRCATPYAITNTATGDASFHGRCSKWEGDTVGGNLFYPYSYSAGIPPSTFTAQNWDKYAETKNTAAASGQPPGRICTVPGTYGVATTTTGDATSGSAVITAVGNLDGYGPGIYLNPSAGFTGIVSILDIDYVNSTITVSAAATSTSAGITLSLSTPTFVAMPNLP